MSSASNGIPNDRDNCPGVKNGRAGSAQANCNADAEIDREAAEMGDACDPVPCPKARASGNVSVTISETPSGICKATRVERVIENTIDLKPIGSHNPFDGSLQSQTDRETQVRFCQPSTVANRFCTSDENQTQDPDFDKADTQYALWREITLPDIGPLGAPAAAPKGASGFFDYPSSLQISLHWDYWTDRAGWINDSWFSSANPAKPPYTPDSQWHTVSGLDGVLGIRAGGWRSAMLLGTNAKNLRFNGIHESRNLGDGYATGQGLGRHYFAMAPDRIREREVARSSAYPCGPWTFALYCVGLCRPFSIDLESLRDSHKQVVTNPDPWKHDFPEKSFLVTNGADWGIIDKSGEVVLTPGLMTMGLETAVSDPNLLYVPASEASSLHGGVYQNVQGIIISADGTAILDSVVATPTGLDLQGPNPDLTLGYGPMARSLGSVISPREMFVPVFSRIAGALFIIGGREIMNPNQTTGEIWMITEDPTPILLNVPNYQPGAAMYRPDSVLAATVGTADRMLWILDDNTDVTGYSDEARLVRINLTSLEYEEIWNGPRNWNNQRHWLTVDADGRVLLTAAGYKWGTYPLTGFYKTARIEADPFVFGTADLTAGEYGYGDLPFPPLVDADGYFYVTIDSQGEIQPYQVPELYLPAAYTLSFGDLF